ncbi:hypothetical protein [Singulisphaera sp. PoT]|uniref:hypothetical protein n=1 Tax=Singulisphaera sp. PoT TaxID=3411797 RepID=UPI003BF4A1AC
MSESTTSKAQAVWEPLVFGKTSRADYSYLAIPASFGQDDRAWAEGFLRGSRLQASYACAFGVARYFLFKSPTHCGVGVTLPATMLSDDKSKTLDPEGREVYVTLGAVARYDEAEFPERPHHPGIPELAALKRNLRPIFGPLYDEYVAARWKEAPPSEGRALTASPSEPREWFPADLPLISWTPPFALDPDTALEPDDGNRVNLWPPGVQDNLWSSACLAKPPMSLCLNFGNEKDALAPMSRFGNVVVEKCREKATVYRGGAPLPTEPIQEAPAQDAAKVDAKAIPKDIVKAAPKDAARNDEPEETPPPPEGPKRTSLFEIRVFGRKIIGLNLPGSRKR